MRPVLDRAREQAPSSDRSVTVTIPVLEHAAIQREIQVLEMSTTTGGGVVRHGSLLVQIQRNVV
jgi:hypothetical protein